MTGHPARERMLSRLAGMDLKRVFDLDGSGFIDPTVLTRSLKLWDREIFTDETVEDFLQWSNLEKGGSGALNIQDMVGFVKAKAPKMPRIGRRSTSRGSRVSGSCSEVGSEAMSFAAAPRSCRTKEPTDEGGARARTGSQGGRRRRRRRRP